jgi:D-glycero-D-manno-heptose 1,7-bisphosphate phosphatase
MKKKYDNFFLDRDGIINEIVMRGGKVSSPWRFNEFNLLAESNEFIKSLFRCKKNVFVVTNQPDISRKNLKIDDLNKMHSYLFRLYGFREITACTHDDDDQCACRKPKPGLILDVINKYGLEKETCCMIGDSYKDISAAQNAEIDSFFYETTYNIEQIVKLPKNRTNICIFRDFNELRYII